jgi:hypothetical protein
MGFICTLAVGGICFIRIALNCKWMAVLAKCRYLTHTFKKSFIDLDVNSPQLSQTRLDDCTLFSTLCQYLDYSTWTFGFIVWLALNLTWIFLLVVIQLVQISIAKTSNESANYYRFEYLVHPHYRHDGVPEYRKRFVTPFDLGVMGNCVDFWTSRGKLSDVK